MAIVKTLYMYECYLATVNDSFVNVITQSTYTQFKVTYQKWFNKIIMDCFTVFC